MIDLYNSFNCSGVDFVEFLINEVGTTEESANDIFVALDNWSKNSERYLL